MSKQILTVLAVISLAKSELPLIGKLQKSQKPSDCGQYSKQLRDLLILMCNNIAFNTENDLIRDACIGCFQQASTSNNNQPSLVALSDCAENYLEDTRYRDCSSQIDSNPGTGPCVTGYCKFVTCIRRINADLLIAQCYEQASADNDAMVEEDQVILVKNITSCILARTRCAPVNPISGQRQSNTLTTNTYNKWGKPKINVVPLYNTLQITPEGDLRIIRFPGTTRIQNHFCTPQPNLHESSWLEYSC